MRKLSLIAWPGTEGSFVSTLLHQGLQQESLREGMMVCFKTGHHLGKLATWPTSLVQWLELHDMLSISIFGQVP